MKGKCLLTGTVALAGAVSCAPKVEHPNVVYIFPDQYRASALGFLAEEPYRSHIGYTPDPVFTPNIDAIARNGVVLTNAISNCPISSPHRGMLLTGCYAHESGITLNCNSSRPVSSLREDLTTISDVYAAEGYDCAYIGKYHADFPLPNDPSTGDYVEARRPAWDAYTPAERRHGFNFWYSYGTFDEHRNPHYWNTDGLRHDPHVWSPTHEADVAIKYIKSRSRRSRKPFFMMVGMNPPHSAYSSYEDCAPADSGMYAGASLKDILVRPNADTTMLKAAESARIYFTQVHGIDREVGRIYKALEEVGLLENTIFVFTSDHGETMCSHGLLDPKNSPYTESVNVPFVLSYPRHVEPGIQDWMLSSPDIMPTLLALSGFAEKVPASVQGRDLSGALLGEEDGPHDALYFKYLDGEKDSEGLVRSAFSAARGIITDRYTFSVELNRDGTVAQTLLFDNLSDPYQLRNIAPAERPALVDSLLQIMTVKLENIHDAWAENCTIQTVKERLTK